MGRRSINTTKSGKYMNPTDQARKEARKRELKKNKKQRMLVRAAVLKGKDPHQILADLERLDQMEYNVNTAPPLNEKVLKDKRRKLKETWDRLCRLYFKEDNDKFLELKRLETEYETKRNQLIKFYEAVKSTQDVALDDIPLPAGPMDSSQVLSDLASTGSLIEPPSILKKPASIAAKLPKKEPPGVPPGPPPVLSDVEDESDDEKEKNKKVRFGDDSVVKQKETDISEFLKEIEQVEKTVNLSQTSQPSTGPVGVKPTAASFSCVPPPPLFIVRPSTSTVPSAAPLRPAATQPQVGIAGRPTLPVIIPQSTIRPSVIPQTRLTQPTNRNVPSTRPSQVSNPSQTRKDDKKATHFVSDKATIEAKPQLRNLSADATRFMPVSLRVKRPEKSSKKNPKDGSDGTESNFYSNSYQSNGDKTAQTKDDAYEVFMKELQGLL
ncbi:hypothetical protein B4U79_00039 [Dinothrombium tinctorium]|uniref:Wbp11/ELF5/Saf1 N-terminal domain-containing protein n=1 Tax=Dinothrombium tinctorium TaxID=1965070 RepID=A0A3S3PMS8_9ACAR|nr:hypothetical protein B4U79_09390 [Dinothrombium tinctorium]RWS12952.1 hypothetical protein B4U79_09515 [Dinothrombium tinctorium]RWS12958.1 hypothetical protein B4U79_00039 [Dinothrombium tinctorium]